MAKNEMSAAEKYRKERKQRLAKAAKKNARRQHKLNLSEKAKSAIAVIVVIAIFAGIGVPLGIKGYNNSATKEQKIMAVQYKDMEISKPVYSYFVSRAYNNIYSYSQQYSQYGLNMGYDISLLPGEQEYTEELEGYENPTWLDYFDYTAKETIKQIEVYNEKAQELGITLDEEHQQQLDENMKELEDSAAQNNVSVNVLLEGNYGKGVTKSLLKELITKQLIAEMYMEHVKDEYKDGYKQKEVEKYYKDNKDSYEVVTLRYYTVNAEKVTVPSTDEEGNDTSTQEVNDETMREAKAIAEEFASKVKDDENFKKLAAEHYKTVDKDSADDYVKVDSRTLYKNSTRSDLSSLSEDALKWAFSAKRGETYVDEVEDSGYTVYYVSVPAGKNLTEDMTYDVRHILVKFKEDAQDTVETADDTAAEPSEAADDTAGEATTEPATQAAEPEITVDTLDVKAYPDAVIDLAVNGDTATDKVAYKQAQNILIEYLDGKRTEEAFGALATKYSEDHQDGAEVVDGGLYADVPMGQMVPEFEAWATAEGRKIGDVGIVEHDGGDSGYSGYHVMYCVNLNHNGVAWETSVKTDKADEDFDKFSEELLAKDEYALTVLDEEAVKGTLDFVTTLAENVINNSNSSAQ